MAREKIRRIKHKVPKFRDIYDESLDWQERVELQHLGRKVKRKSHKRKIGFEDW